MNEKESEKMAALILNIYEACTRLTNGNLTTLQTLKLIRQLLKTAEKEK